MDWQGFYIASAGASAALTGLIFVGISININKILSSVMLIDRAFISILLLLTALVISLIRLIPGQDGYVLGTEVLITVLISWSIITRKDIGIFKLREKKFRYLYILNMIINQMSLIPYIVSAYLFLNGSIYGDYWMSASIIFSYIKAILDSWVLMVEINR